MKLTRWSMSLPLPGCLLLGRAGREAAGGRRSIRVFGATVVRFAAPDEGQRHDVLTVGELLAERGEALANRSLGGARLHTAISGVAHYLAKDVTASGDASCKNVAAQRANGALQYTWSFEWPTRAQWAAGQRYGYCWVPQT